MFLKLKDNKGDFSFPKTQNMLSFIKVKIIQIYKYIFLSKYEVCFT